MELLSQLRSGFQSIDADPALKEQALKFLQQWLTEPDFAPYRPQLHWLIQQQKWSGLLDRFYQIMPFGTGGRPSVGVNQASKSLRNRPKLLPTCLSARTASTYAPAGNASPSK